MTLNGDPDSPASFTSTRQPIDTKAILSIIHFITCAQQKSSDYHFVLGLSLTYTREHMMHIRTREKYPKANMWRDVSYEGIRTNQSKHLEDHNSTPYISFQQPQPTIHETYRRNVWILNYNFCLKYHRLRLAIQCFRAIQIHHPNTLLPLYCISW